VEDDLLKLPPLHWTPKKHKTPTGSRFIIGSKKSSLKPIGKDLTRIFKVIFNHKRRYFRKAGFYSGLKYFWCIDNHQEVVDALERISNKNRAKTITTFDFSTLYTKIPHSKLIEVLCELVDSTFNDTNRRWISVSKRSAKFVKTKKGKCYEYSKEDVKKAVTYLINNAYFRVGNAIFRQKIGIPMGSDPAPFFANLFLFFYESKWVKHNAHHNYRKAKGVFNTVRYIDDLNTLNDDLQFSNYISEIYPPELILNKENSSPLQATYLDLEITVDNNKYVYKLYDKRNAYPFSIVRFPFICSNIPKRMFYSTIQAEIIRIARATSVYTSLLESCKPFLDRMLKQGASRIAIQKPIERMITKHISGFSKFGQTRAQVVNDILGLI
jgi:hypothetical protein